MGHFDNNENFGQPENITFFVEIYHDSEEDESKLNEIYKKLYLYGNEDILDQCVIEVEDKTFNVSLF